MLGPIEVPATSIRPPRSGSVTPEEAASYEPVGFEVVGELTWTFYALEV